MEKRTASKDNLGFLALGSIWSREEKHTLKDRSMITISLELWKRNYYKVQ